VGQWRAERDPVPDLACGTRGEITTTSPQTTLGARATTVASSQRAAATAPAGVIGPGFAWPGLR
jgi:hypothetical protein